MMKAILCVLMILTVFSSTAAIAFPTFNKTYEMICDSTPNDPDYLVMRTSDDYFHYEYSDSESTNTPSKKVHHQKNVKIENVKKLLGVENRQDFPGRVWHYETITFTDNTFEDEYFLLINQMKRRLEDKITIRFTDSKQENGQIIFESGFDKNNKVVICPFHASKI